METSVSSPTRYAGGAGVKRLLLFCGIISSLLYAVMMTAIRFEGYNFADQTVSELSAIGAPSRALWMVLGSVYTLLIIAFGWGVRASAGKNKALKRAGTLILAFALLGLVWPFAPMQMRGEPFALTDALHVALGSVSVLLMLFAMIFGVAAFGKQFRIYSLISILLFIVFGALTGILGPRIAGNLPTPWIGIWERINIMIFLLWVAVLSIRLIRLEKTRKIHPESIPDSEQPENA